MHQISFGSVLKEARLAQGRDLASVSRELRIRQDIIVSIENSDFKRMPSRGYARNMIIAYSRLLGLNAQDVSRMYLDQEYAYQVEQAHQNVGDSIRMHRDPHGRNKGGYDTSSFEKVGGAATAETVQAFRSLLKKTSTMAARMVLDALCTRRMPMCIPRTTTRKWLIGRAGPPCQRASTATCTLLRRTSPTLTAIATSLSASLLLSLSSLRLWWP